VAQNKRRIEMRIYLYITFMLFIACKSTKSKTGERVDNLPKDMEFSASEKLRCDEVTNYGARIKCLFRLAFQGNDSAINELLKDIEEKPESIYRRRSDDYKMRGAKLFEKILELSNNYDCNHNLGLENEGGIAKFTYVRKQFFDMVDSIDGYLIDDYILRNMPKSMELWNDKNCSQDTISKLSWDIINQAWREGKIKLKDFGQE
jgi:hypothetical protein